MQEVFGLTEPEGPVLIFVDNRYQVYANYSERVLFLREKPDIVQHLCRRIDDGNDPCVLPMNGGCTAGTQLADEQGHWGYFLVFLPGYTRQTAQANMDLIELVLAQAQLIFGLIGKNSRFSDLQASRSIRTSPKEAVNCL